MAAAPGVLAAEESAIDTGGFRQPGMGRSNSLIVEGPGRSRIRAEERAKTAVTVPQPALSAPGMGQNGLEHGAQRAAKERN